jgi:hypothetical protein
VKDLKKFLGVIPIALFAIMLGCGGGGGGGGGDTDGSTTGFTAGDTTAQPGETIIGQLKRNGVAMPNVTVRFWDNGNNQVGSDVTNAEGYFTAVLGTNATKVDVDASTVTGGTIGFRYGTQIFQASSGGLECRVSLPTIVPGTLTQMPNGQFRFPDPASPPLPPPTGCVP